MARRGKARRGNGQARAIGRRLVSRPHGASPVELQAALGWKVPPPRPEIHRWLPGIVERDGRFYGSAPPARVRVRRKSPSLQWVWAEYLAGIAAICEKYRVALA
jgi:hypothetical protein